MHRKISTVLCVLLMLSPTTVLAGDDCIFIKNRDLRNLCKGDCMFIVDRDMRDACKGVTSATKELPVKRSQRRQQDSSDYWDEGQSGHEDSDSLDEEGSDSSGYEYYVPSDADRTTNRRGKAGRR